MFKTKGNIDNKSNTPFRKGVFKRLKNLSCLAIILVLNSFFSIANAGNQPPSPANQPHLLRSGENILLTAGYDPGFLLNASATPWTFRDALSQLDFTVSRQRELFDPSDLSGSILFSRPLIQSDGSAPGNHHFFSSPTGGNVQNAIPVEPYKTYTLSAYIKSNIWPAPDLSLKVDYWNTTFNSGGTEVAQRRLKPVEISFSSAAAGQWQEIVATFTVPEWVNYVTVGAFMKYGIIESLIPQSNAKIWLDDISLTEGLTFEQPPTAKIPFIPQQSDIASNKPYIKVDALGNVERCVGETCEDFFPICVYGSGNRRSSPDGAFSDYSRQGFNCNMWSSIAQTITDFSAASSDFNPDGMLSSLYLSRYTGLSAYGITGIERPAGNSNQASAQLMDYVPENVRSLEDTLIDIQAQGLDNNLIFYYWDQENFQISHWYLHQQLAAKIRQIDNLHPIYMLQGQYGLASRYSNTQPIVDITGSYTNTYLRCAYERLNDSGAIKLHQDLTYSGLEQYCPPYSNGGSEQRLFDQIPSGARALQILDNMELQNQPVVIAQINAASYKTFRAKVFASLANGAKGIGMWRDNFANVNSDAEKAELGYWWPNFPNIRREIMSLLPMIKEPHWTEWQANIETGQLDYGTRTYDGDAYLLTYNEGHQPTTASLSFTGLSYSPYALVDAAYSSLIEQFNDGIVELTEPAYSGRILRLEDDYRRLRAFNYNFSTPNFNLNNIVDIDRPFGDADFSDGKFNRVGFECNLVSWPESTDARMIAAEQLYNSDLGALSISTTVRIATNALIAAPTPLDPENPTRDESLAILDNCSTGPISTVGLVSKGGTTISEPGYSIAYDYSTNELVALLFDGDKRLEARASTPGLNDESNHTVSVTFYDNGEVDFFIDSEIPSSVDAPILNETAANNISIVNAIPVGNPDIQDNLLKLNGNNYIVVNDNDLLDIANFDFSIALTVRLNPTNEPIIGLISKGITDTNDSGYMLAYDVNTMKIMGWLSDGSNLLTPSSNPVDLLDGNFHTIIVRWNRAANVDFFVDGQPLGSQDISALEGLEITNDQDLTIGLWQSYFADGDISNIQMIMAALSNEDIQALTNELSNSPINEFYIPIEPIIPVSIAILILTTLITRSINKNMN